MNENSLDIENLTAITALFVHAAKIDEVYTDKERKIIVAFLNLFTENTKLINDIMQKAELIEDNSNQLLSYTNILKKSSLKSKSIIIEQLWKIILSDNNSDEYENNLMRRICGLIYFPDKLSGEIKIKIKNN
jgi:uncharacterized tellurite resistance protein B-like protein